MTRVAIDTNVFISALVFGGIPQQVLDLISSQDIPLFTSRSIIDEVIGILIKKFKWSQAEIEAFLPPMWLRCIIIGPTVQLNVCPDPDDNHVLECAAAAKAYFLITGNAKQFPKTYKTTRVVSPRQFLDRFQPGDK